MLTIFARLPWLHKALIGLFSGLIVVALFFLPHPKDLMQAPNRLKLGQHYPLQLNYDLLVKEESLPSSTVLQWKRVTVQSGESSALLFKKVGLTARDLYVLTSSNDEIERQLTRLKPGDELLFGFNDEQDLVQLRRKISSYESFVVTRSDNGFTSKFETKEVYFQYNYAEATITSNFWNAATGAGLTANQIMQLAGIFGWDIDFALDIRSGDNFKILYQEKVVEGEVTDRGDIIAATFTNQGKTFSAILDDSSGNYYDENGRAMKKAFLRSPLDFRRVSSNFNPQRLHPVTGLIRPHRGTDYVAPVGTPIWAAGDGTVQQAGYNQFNGNYVFIRHSNTYVTKYLHLQRRFVKTGERVKQGQVIGKLGGTGRVTGPHLHYEFLVNGVHKNPRTVDLPMSQSLTGKARDTFIANAKIRLEKLDRYSELLFAKQ
ncbi:peptidoglycan DD-metalloendopeptidase family protein [Vibrio porteresiae]|uniref:Peptidoglycan DD-metalloendopeptidase family protein n=1 Tax=Vibrio porteresiae DSM 19223 TaxID=1123496 RepID=A0ABZ0QB30_9VIBR|nr:peptidoglycan DD-metalloendopeptidase family protein [Vibrio porteresiae]WPC73649.1 peptidoglycan DD-metalloendopeptidase family protein [Vibrio porteresiae DSM 19223]